MSRLSNLITDAIHEVDREDGRRPWATAAALVVERADALEMEALAYKGAAVLCKQAATRQGAAAKRAGTMSSQTSMFPDLRFAYPLTAEENITKRTETLTQTEFRNVIAVRETKVDEDLAHLAKLKEAFSAAMPVWAKQPNLTFGQCCCELVTEAR